MGERRDGGRLIDEAFAGLSNPRRTLELGDAGEGAERPGATLVASVREFEAAGGFRGLASDRSARRIEGDAPDPRKGGDWSTAPGVATPHGDPEWRAEGQE